jgi:hypothetical protein
MVPHLQFADLAREETAFHDETVTFTSDELTALSELLRSLPGEDPAVAVLADKPESRTACDKIEEAKWASYKPIEATDAEANRLHEAEEMLRRAGFSPDEQGNWHPA